MRIFALVVTIFTICGTTALINGCDEEMEIAAPIIFRDPALPIEEPETPEEPEKSDVVMGDLKKPEESPKQTEPGSSLTVTQVRWYKTQQAKHPLTDTHIICAEKDVYVRVTFSGPVEHAAGNDNVALPALFVAIGNTETRIEILPNESAQGSLRPNTGKKTPSTHETAYMCRYGLPARIEGSPTITLRVGETTVDIEDGTITGDLLYPAPFTVAEIPETVTLPNSIFIPPKGTTLSKNEENLKKFFALRGQDPTEPDPQRKANKPVDRISILPLKDREEVYNALVTAVDLPFFAEAAEKMKSKNVMFASLFMEAVKTKNWEEFNSFLKNVNRGIGISGEVNEASLAQIYFEENPEERPHSKECSCYWMLLEYYRIQLQYPHLEVSMTENRNLLLCLYRKSAQAGNILGLANPWN